MPADEPEQAGQTSPAFEIASPRPGAMIQSLRAFGYDLATAVADLIDNSISVGARNIWLDFIWDGENSRFVLTDDGRGMSEEALIEAMRPGSQNPLDIRSARDLGRFGLGLKTASFSQCRRLTVASRCKKGDLSTRCWDLNYVTRKDEWRLLHEGFAGAENCFSRLPAGASGTVVVWEDMDRLVAGTRTNNQQDENRFLEHIERVKFHTAMVFHRFLERPVPIKVWLNDRIVTPWDPFLRSETATQILTEEPLMYRGEKIVVRPYVLPHHSRIAPEVRAHASGLRGWHAQQGFYVYRNDRMLVDGDWLGLGFQKLPHHDLARISLDFPNSLDGDWHIDVKKSRARPPSPLRDHLKRIARLTQERAANAYRHRGRVVTGRTGQPDFNQIWGRKLLEGKASYAINRNHPLVKRVLEGETTLTAVSALLRLIEETVPIAFITIDNAERPDQHRTPFASIPAPEVQEVISEFFTALTHEGLSCEEAREHMRQMEVFQRYRSAIDVLPDRI